MTQIDRPQNIRLGIVLMMIGLALFTGGEAVVKTLAPKYDVTQIVWSRYVFHALVTFLLFYRSGIFQLAKTTRPWLHVSRSALMLIATSLFFFALRYLPLADAVAIHFIAPILITAFSIPILKEQVGWGRWAAIFVGFIGAMIIIRPGGGGTHWAAILPLGSAVCYAIYQILTRIASKTDSTQTSLFWTSVFGVGVTSLFVPFFWVTPTLTEWGLMIALGGMYGIGHYLLIRGLEMAPASRLSPFLYTQIIWATLFGVIFFGQFPDMITIAGAVVVIASGLYIWWRETSSADESAKH
jgi:drug/metabolite transporter (DMT)-like permease